MNLLETVEQDTMPTHYKQMTQAEMIARVTEIKDQLGENLFIPCHHYQKDEVVPFADAIGDSLQLAQIAAQNKKPNISFFAVFILWQKQRICLRQASRLLLCQICALVVRWQIWRTFIS